MEPHVFVFLDTNIALHYKRADQIDWLRVSKAQSVTLIVPIILVRELENQKAHNPSSKLRTRAKNYISWLSELDSEREKCQLRQNVKLDFSRM